MKYCGNCGNPVPDGDEYCSFCGSKAGMEEPVFAQEHATQTEQQESLISHNRFCQNCGFPMEPGDDYCTECGARYGTSTSPAKEPVSPEKPRKRRSVYIVIFVILVILIGAGTILGVVLFKQNPGTSSHDLSSQSFILNQSTSSESVLSSTEPSPLPETSNLKDDSFQDVVDQAISDGDYPTAIHLLEYWQEQEPDDPSISEQLEETRESYQNEVIVQANSMIQQGDQEGAISLLTEAKGLLGNSQEIDLVLNALEINKNEPSVSPTPAPAQQPSSSSETSSSYILPQSSQRLLTYQDIAGLSQHDLMLARNEIFARHGRIFNDPAIRAYFESQSWYHGTIAPEEFTDDLLSQVEKDNIAFIQQYEKTD